MSGYNPVDIPRQNYLLGDFETGKGDVIRSAELSVVVHGEPKDDGSNVIIVVPSIGGNAHRLDFLIGDGLAFDPNIYCVIGFDTFGNGFASSPSNSVLQPGSAFPHFSIRDMVRAQKQVLDKYFNLDRILMVAGASMGGMQALEWAVSYPTFMSKVVAMVPLAKSPPWTRMVNSFSRRILEGVTDPAEAASLRASFLSLLICNSPAGIAMASSGDDPLPWMKELEDQVRPDLPASEDWIAQTYAYDAHDIGTAQGFDGDTDAALRSIQAQTLILMAEDDLYNPTAEQEKLADQIPNVVCKTLPGGRGHADAAPISPTHVSDINIQVSTFLTSRPFP